MGTEPQSAEEQAELERQLRKSELVTGEETSQEEEQNLEKANEQVIENYRE